MATSELRFAIKPSLTASELDDVDTLVREARWNQLAADWRIFTDLGRVYAAHTRADRIVATTATLPYGSRFAWISMVLVKSEFRRHGLATQLMRQAMDELAREGRIPILDATPDGRAVYRRLGFEDSWGFRGCIRRERRRPAAAPFAGPAGTSSYVRSSIDDWPALCAYDARRIRRRPKRRCLAACAGDCRPPSSSPSMRAASSASRSAATAASPAQLVPVDCGRRRHRRPRCSRARSTRSKVRCSSISPTARQQLRNFLDARGFASGAAVHAHVVRVVDALRRPGADLRRDRPGIRLKLVSG